VGVVAAREGGSAIGGVLPAKGAAGAGEGTGVAGDGGFTPAFKGVPAAERTVTGADSETTLSWDLRTAFRMAVSFFLEPAFSRIMKLSDFSSEEAMDPSFH